MNELDFSREVEIEAGTATLDGFLDVPPNACGLVIFAHGSGSSRFSPRNRKVAKRLQAAGLATLLVDLLTPQEEAVDSYTRHLRFDIPLLAERLGAAADRCRNSPELDGLNVGFFGASTGAAAALIAAATRPWVGAVVSRGGRPDLAIDVLSQVKVPTLLIVGGRDTEVLEMNREACARLGGPKELTVVPGATHLFEEAGALDEVARLAARWFEHWLRPAGDVVPPRVGNTFNGLDDAIGCTR